MQVECAQVSLVGDREDNQDRAGLIVTEHATLLLAVDGMGGHVGGSLAAETAVKSMTETFYRTPQPIFDPMGFLHLALSRTHDDVVRLGIEQSLEMRPRATVAACLVQEGAAYWAHIGDSRVYHIRHHTMVTRTRDHSHVEFLLKEGKITAQEVRNHPMRNFVESCLGGDAAIPEMTMTGRKLLQQGDLLLLCTDGLWANLADEEIAQCAQDSSKVLQVCLQELGQRAVTASSPYSDNATVVALRMSSNP